MGSIEALLNALRLCRFAVAGDEQDSIIENVKYRMGLAGGSDEEE